MIQFYPLFKFYFPFVSTHYHTLPYQKNKEKIKTRIKLNHNIVFSELEQAVSHNIQPFTTFVDAYQNSFFWAMHSCVEKSSIYSCYDSVFVHV